MWNGLLPGPPQRHPFTRCMPSSDSASLPGGNQVDGLPRAPHTQALGVSHGGLGPAPIYALDFEKLRSEGKWSGKLDQRFVQVLNNILTVLADKVVSKFVNEKIRIHLKHYLKCVLRIFEISRIFEKMINFVSV